MRTSGSRHLERLEKFDQCMLVVIAQIGAEVVPLVDDEIGTLAHRDEVGNDRKESLNRLLVGGIVGQALERLLELDKRRDQLFRVPLLLLDIPAFSQDLDVGKQ